MAENQRKPKENNRKWRGGAGEKKDKCIAGIMASSQRRAGNENGEKRRNGSISSAAAMKIISAASGENGVKISMAYHHQ
jgi:hypothetical protein